MGWLKEKLRTLRPGPDGARAAMRLSYAKHRRGASRGKSSTEDSPHVVGVFGALGTRYKGNGTLPSGTMPEAILWPELAPFLEMPEADAVTALVEYVVWQEYPGFARFEWLYGKINQSVEAILRSGTNGSDRRVFLALAVVNHAGWTTVLDGANLLAIEDDLDRLHPSGQETDP